MATGYDDNKLLGWYSKHIVVALNFDSIIVSTLYRKLLARNADGMYNYVRYHM